MRQRRRIYVRDCGHAVAGQSELNSPHPIRVTLWQGPDKPEIVLMLEVYMARHIATVIAGAIGDFRRQADEEAALLIQGVSEGVKP